MKKQEYGLRQSMAKKSRFPLLFPVCLLLWAGAFMSYATQTIAAALKYHPDLGRPVFNTYYLPWKVFEWNKYITNNPIDNKVDLIFGAFVLSVVVLFFLMLRRKPKGNLNLHGTATWAKKKRFDRNGA